MVTTRTDGQPSEGSAAGNCRLAGIAGGHRALLVCQPQRWRAGCRNDGEDVSPSGPVLPGGRSREAACFAEETCHQNLIPAELSGEQTLAPPFASAVSAGAGA